MTTTVTKRYYPRLSELVNLTDLPAYLQFIQTGANAVFSKLHYKNLQYSKSPKGDAAFYSLDLVSTQKLSIPIPGGMELVLNPDYNSTISSIPISVQYQWGILAYINNFDLKGFDFNVKSIYKLGLQVFRLTDEELIGHSLTQLVNPPNGTTRYAQLVTDINAKFNTKIIAPTNENESLAELVSRIKSQGAFVVSLADVVYETYLNTSTDALTMAAVENFFSIMMPNGIEAYIKSLIKPSFKASLKLSAAIEFPRSILVPVYDKDGKNPANLNQVITPTPAPYSVIPADGTGSPKVQLKMGEALFYVDSDTGLGYSKDVALSTNLPAQIGNTGFIISFTNVKLDISTNTNIPEATADGRPNDFVGVYVGEAEIILPTTFKKIDNSQTSISGVNATRRIIGKNILAGTGGFSGTVGLETNVAGAIPFKIGNFEIAITDLALNFHMNKLLSSAIAAKIKIPALGSGGQAKYADVNVFVKDSDNFKVSGSFKANPITLNCFNVFDFKVDTLTYEEINNRKALGLSGVLSFKNDIAGLGSLLPKNIDIEKLVIYDDGRVDFKLGSIPIPPFKLKLGVVEVGVSGLSYSVTKLNNREYGVISFDGSINTGSGGVDGQANGVKLFFSIDSGSTDIFLRVDSLRVSVKIPGTATPEEARVIIEGFISIKSIETNPPSNTSLTEYGGGVSVVLNDLDISAGATIRMIPDKSAFLVDLGLEMGVPIPLGPTGLGVYGFRGLIGNNYHINRQNDESWWQYYKRKDPVEGIDARGNKFEGYTGFNIGAGATIGTVGDSGFTFNSKLFVLLGLPNVLLFQGQSAMLKKRMGILSPQDPPFVTFLSIDENSISSGMGVNYLAPMEGDDAGEVLTMQAIAQMAFFYKDSSAWYINFGKDFPVEERVRARLFDFIDAYAFLMISAKGIKAGAGASFSFKKSLGPVKVGASFGASAGGLISFKPFQMGGYLEAYGEVYAKVYKFGVSLGIKTLLAAEGPKPFMIRGAFHLSIGLPWPFDDIDISVDMEWKKSNRVAADKTPIPFIDSTKTIPVSAINMHTNETFPVVLQSGAPNVSAINWDDCTIPMDSFIDIEFAQTPRFNLDNNSNVIINGNINGSDYTFNSPPVKSLSDVVKHGFVVNNITIKALNTSTGTWVNYNIWEAASAHLNLLSYIGDDPTGKLPLTLGELLSLPNASIQQLDPGSRKQNKLRIMAQDMFSYVNQAAPGSVKLEYFGVDAKKLFCYKEGLVRKKINWESKAVGSKQPVNKANPLDENVNLKASANEPEVVAKSGFTGLTKALKVNTKNGTEINFVEPVGNVKMKISLDLSDFYTNGASWSTGQPRSLEGRYVLLVAKFYKRVQTGTSPDGYPIYGYTMIGKTQFWPSSVTNTNTELQYTAPGGQLFDRVVISCVNDLYSTPTANAVMLIGNNYYTRDEPFKGVIGKVSMYEVAPYSAVGYIGNGYVCIGKWELNNSLVNSAKVPNSYPPVTFDSAASIGGDNNRGRHLNSFVAKMLGNDGVEILYPNQPSQQFYKFNFINQGVQIPETNYTSEPSYYNLIPSNYNLGTIDNIISQEQWEFINGAVPVGLRPPYKKLNGGHKFRIYATIKTTDTSPEKRVIIDRRRKVWDGYDSSIPFTNYKDFEYGFTMYLQYGRLHVDLYYDDKFTFADSTYNLTDGNAHSVGFEYDPELCTLSVWINYVPVANNIPVTDFTIKRGTRTKDIFIHEISYQTEEHIQIASTLPSQASLQSELNSVQNGLKKSVQPVWRPDTKYLIEINGVHNVDGVNNPQKYNVLFRTKGPVGFFHTYKEDYGSQSSIFKVHKKYSEQKEEEIALAGLKGYLDKIASKPDVDGNLIYVKPLYRNNPSIALYYLKPYIKLMYSSWPAYNGLSASNYELNTSIIDPETLLEVPSTLTWKVSSRASSSPSVDLWNKILGSGLTCVTTGGQITQFSYNAEFQINQKLKPQKIYELNLLAMLNLASSKLTQKIFSVAFKTSKYADAHEQFMTYNLSSTKKAFFNLGVLHNSTSQQLFTDLLGSMRDVTISATSTAPDMSTALKAVLPNYNTKFELLTHVVIPELRSLPKPMTTEIHRVADGNGQLLGFLFRSDEPIIDPLLDEEFKYGSTTNKASVELFSSTTLISTKLIYSKDCSEVFIKTNTALSDLNIKVNLYQFNPEAASNNTTIKTTEIIAI